ncbi:MAG TPA: hypothetical protein VHE33_18750 [Acidobacteriaceae bacterium]|nr:hypothetical protein [Acidobacteriaceae bacterium]
MPENSRSQCLLCYNTIPTDAYICTECESWQLFKRRRLALALKVVLVVFAPLMAWMIAEIYQSQENIRSTVEAHVTHVTDQIAALVGMAKDLQASSDSLSTNCSGTAEKAANLCLSEYINRVNHINELVAQISWKTGLLPVAEEIDDVQRKWQEIWWGQVANKVRTNLVTMAYDGRLLKCQAVDFGSSECGGTLNRLIQPFRDQTSTLMCVYTLALHEHLSGLYSLLPRSSERSRLLEGVNWQLKKSFCGEHANAQPSK